MACLLVTYAALPVAAQDAPHPWYRGNTHTHTFWSDGNQFPEMVADAYKQRGYDFLVLSDHNVLSEGQKWVAMSHVNETVTKRAKADVDALGLYQQRFGDDWVQTRDSEPDEQGHVDVEVRLKTLEEFRPLVEEPGRFLMIRGEEISQGVAGKQVHTNVMNLKEVIPRQEGDSIREIMRLHARAAQQQEEALGEPVLAHLNHPNYKGSITAEDLAAVTEVEFVEVYNGHPGTLHRGDEHHPGDERLWDIANTLRLGRMHAPPVFGIATDDAHNHHNQRNASTGRGWINVRADELSAPAIITAMRAGDFYASTGVTLTDIRYDAETRTVTLKIDPEPGERYTTAFIGTRENYDASSTPRLDHQGQPIPQTTRLYSDDIGVELATKTGTTASYQLAGDELYVRATITSDRAPDNPVYGDQRKQAWTQPFGWQRHVTEQGSSRLSDPMP